MPQRIKPGSVHQQNEANRRQHQARQEQRREALKSNRQPKKKEVNSQQFDIVVKGLMQKYGLTRQKATQKAAEHFQIIS